MIESLFGEIDHASSRTASIRRRDHLTFRGNVSAGRHGWLRLTPAYSLRLVEELLAGQSERSFVLEPFAGTGTTLLACAERGIPCHGIDVNPFLVWLGNLKLAHFKSDCAQLVENVAAQVVTRAEAPNNAAWTPDLHQIDKWWDPPTVSALSSLCHEIKCLHGVCDEQIIGLLKVAFCRVMIQSANVTFGHQSMSFKPDDDSLGLIPESPPETMHRILAAFTLAAREVARSAAAEQPKTKAEVFLGSIIREIGKGHELLGRYVHKYFEDIKQHLDGLRNVLASGAKCHYVVRNSKFYNTMLPVERIYAALFEEAGFVGVSVEIIRKRTSKKELFEFIVNATAPKNQPN